MDIRLMSCIRSSCSLDSVHHRDFDVHQDAVEAINFAQLRSFCTILRFERLQLEERHNKSDFFPALKGEGSFRADH
jgi:hypothetical protein